MTASTPTRRPPPGATAPTGRPPAGATATTPRPAVTPPALRRSVFARPLSWRNPWTMLLAALAAFQAGVITTLVWTSGRTNLGVAELRPPVAPPFATPPLASAPPAAPPPTPAAPTASPPASDPPPVPVRDRGRGKAPPSRRPSAAPTPAPVVPAAPTAPPAPDALVEVEIDSEPEGATVRIAGAVWGVTPLTAYLPARGPVTIHLELDDHAPAKLVWSPSGRTSLRAVLSPLESP